ncbi:hypothetical protein JKG68_24650 [Microvirga aerilata]|uniref:Uncharacterized protein n=1 Tax=Microvirga aerilata TaxID=670292 RepID=A0A937CYM4_9HYPH|nr:hypothetical protein [Microvirga aerilata]MBL0407128.1 hypothetical protein [Microvirga aerilata]
MTLIRDELIEAEARAMMRAAIEKSGWYSSLQGIARQRRIEKDIDLHWHLMLPQARERLEQRNGGEALETEVQSKMLRGSCDHDSNGAQNNRKYSMGFSKSNCESTASMAIILRGGSSSSPLPPLGSPEPAPKAAQCSGFFFASCERENTLRNPARREPRHSARLLGQKKSARCFKERSEVRPVGANNKAETAMYLQVHGQNKADQLIKCTAVELVIIFVIFTTS